MSGQFPSSVLLFRQQSFAYLFLSASRSISLIPSMNHGSNRLLRSSTESKQYMAKPAFWPAYFPDDCFATHCAIICLTAVVCRCPSSSLVPLPMGEGPLLFLSSSSSLRRRLVIIDRWLVIINRRLSSPSVDRQCQWIIFVSWRWEQTSLRPSSVPTLFAESFRTNSIVCRLLFGLE